uniref:Sulfate transport system permease protein CysT n=1 Tax=Prototheca stagnorum TaxID=215448 RepID=A0A2Z6BEL8_9CHLO|nr:sulfate transport system permease protein [Prototheca stagnorum]BBD20167.1 sulfate transport system permease protein [Prototheca stagnorum]
MIRYQSQTMRRFIETYKTCKPRQYNKFFSKDALEEYIAFILEKHRLKKFITIHISFTLLLPLYAIFFYVYRSPWNVVLQKAKDPIALTAIGLSFKLALITAILNTTLGFMITWFLIRYTFTGKRWIDASIDLPFAMPTSVAGLTLSSLFGGKGWIGSLLGEHQIIYTKAGVLLAMVFVSFPFVVRSVQPVLDKINSDVEIEENAWCLGSEDTYTFSRVIFPLSIPALLNGFSLTFSRALGEFGSVVMVSGNFPFEDLVSSVCISQTLEQYDYTGACVISSIVILGACVFLAIMYCFRYYFVLRKK